MPFAAIKHPLKHPCSRNQQYWTVTSFISSLHANEFEEKQVKLIPDQILLFELFSGCVYGTEYVDVAKCDHSALLKGIHSSMMSEGSSFMKGMILGGIFCLVLSFFETFNSGTHSEGHEHLHHHLKPVSKDELQKLSKSQMSDLALQVRVYCLIMVTPKLLVHWATTNDTWSKHCDKSVFYSSESSKALEAVDLQEQDEWARLRKAIKHAYENAGDLRWFFVARPTTFAIIENLKYLVLDKDPGQPFYIGHTEKSGELEYVEYDSGIVLSYEAMKRLIKVFEDEEKCPERGRALWKMSEEKQLASCLKYSGVYAENGEDSQGKGLFNKKSVSSLISDSMNQNPADVVEACCSDMAITFAGMNPSQMQVLMYGVYRLRPYGHDFHDSLTFLPPKDSDND